MQLKCTCSNEYQDKKYGQGMRVVTPCQKEHTYRCTVCGKEMGSFSSTKDKPKKGK